VVKAVRDEANSGAERNIVLRERRPDSDIHQIPAEDLAAMADSLEKKAYPFRVDTADYLIPSQIHHRPNTTVVFLDGSTTECMYLLEEERFPYLVGRKRRRTLASK